MKDKMIKAALSFAVLCGLGACTKNYLDINSNPYEVDKEQMEAKDYAIASGLSAMFGTVVSTDVNTAQFTDCLLGSTQGGYYADANNGWTNTISIEDVGSDHHYRHCGDDRHRLRHVLHVAEGPLPRGPAA